MPYNIVVWGGVEWGVCGTCTEGEHGEGVCEGSPQADGRELLPILLRELRGLADAGDPEGREGRRD